MSDNDFMMDRGPRNDPRNPHDARYPAVVRDGGYEVARMLRLWAVLGIGVRLFLTYASANRVAVVHKLLNQVPPDTPVRNGKYDLTGLPGAADLISVADDADSLVKLAWIGTIIAVVFFVATSISLHRRRNRDSLAAAVNQNRAIRLAGRLYMIPTALSGIVRSGLNSDPLNSPIDRLHRTSEIDAINIVLQMFVIAFLLIVALAIERELRKATTIPVVSAVPQTG